MRVISPPCLQVYEPFASDFGPLNMGNTFRFCQRLTALLQVCPVPHAALPAAAVRTLHWSKLQACHHLCSTIFDAVLGPVLATIQHLGLRAWCLDLQATAQTGQPVCYCCGAAATKRANAAVLVRQAAYASFKLHAVIIQVCH